MSVIWDGLPASSYGLRITGLSGWLDGPQFTRASVGIPGLFGALPDPMAVGKERTITVDARLRLTDLQDRHEALARLAESLQGERKFTSIDRPRIVTRVHWIGSGVTGISDKTSMYHPTVNVRIAFVCYDGVSYDIEPRTVVLGSTPVQVPTGSAPSVGLLYVSGALTAGTTRTVTYTGINGRPYGSWALRPPLAGELGTGSPAESLGANDHVEIDGLQRTVTKVTSAGVRSSVEHWFSGAHFAIDPKHAARALNAFPRVGLSSGVGLFVYRRAWRQ